MDIQVETKNELNSTVNAFSNGTFRVPTKHSILIQDGQIYIRAYAGMTAEDVRLFAEAMLMAARIADRQAEYIVKHNGVTSDDLKYKVDDVATHAWAK